MRGCGIGALADRAKEYSSRKYTLEIINTFYATGLLVFFLSSGFSGAISQWLARVFVSCALFVLPLYLFITGALYYLFGLPFNFYQSYILEHKYSLSNQKPGNWIADQLKSGAISYIIGLILISVFYYILARNPQTWWLVISVFWIFFSLVLAELAPVIIIPLFFKYKNLSDASLKERVMGLAKRMGINILDCFEIDFSKKTQKANAAFVGLGRNKRVILADTLRDKYTHDEIEVILAHEFAHYKLRHIFKLIFLQAAVTLGIFYFIFRSNTFVLSLFGLSSLKQIAALPVVVLYFMIFGLIMRPLENLFSRRLEKDADRAALEITGKKEEFISVMEKLAAQNLADRKPHPVIKFFFFDHPPIDERIALARERKTWKA